MNTLILGFALPLYGIGESRIVEFVAVPDRGLAWVGLPCAKYVLLSNAIVGLSCGPDELIINRQTNFYQGTEQVKLARKQELLGRFAERLSNGDVDETKTLNLGEKLFGLHSASPFLPASERVRPSAPAAISSVTAKDGGLTIVLDGEKARVTVTLDRELRFLEGNITEMDW